MKKFVKILTITTFLSILFSNCSPESSSEICQSFTGTPTESVSGPTTAAVGEIISLDVNFLVYNDCGFFNQFYEEIIDGIKYITVNAIYDGCQCEDITLIKPTVYNFSASTPGTYKLRFKVTNTTHIEHIIEVTN